jgi:hypothetical protein
MYPQATLLLRPIPISLIALLLMSVSCNPQGSNSSIQSGFLAGISLSMSNSSISSSLASIPIGGSSQVTLTTRDQFGNVFIGSSPLSISFSYSGGTSQGSFGPVSSIGNGTYTAAFTGTVSGTATQLSAQVNGSALTSSLPTVVVTNGAPSSVTVSSNNGQSGTTGAPLASPLAALVEDSGGNPLSGISVNWAVISGGGLVSSCSSSVTNSSGIAYCTPTLGAAAGANSFSASVSGLSAVATFTATGINESFVDASDSATGFGAATISGGTGSCPVGTSCAGTLWDSTNDFVRLIAPADNAGYTATNTAYLDSSWAPQYSSLVSYYRLDDSWNDSIGTNNMLPSGAPVFTTSAKIGSYAASLGGVGDYASVGSAVLTATNNFTLSAWIYPTDLATAKRIAVYIGTGGVNGYGIAASGSTAGTVSVEIGNTWVDQPVSYTANTWHHVVAVRSAGTLTVYLNGVALGNTSNTAPSAPGATTYIGWDGANNKMQGVVDDVAFWNVALTATQIQTIFSRQSAKYSGNFTSRIFSSVDSYASWSNLGWVTTLPFFKPLPDYAGGAVESESSTAGSGYSSLASSSLMSGIAGLWHLDEPSGTSGANSVVDRSGSGNDGEPSSVTFGAPGEFGSAATFNGSSSSISIADSSSLRPSNLSLSLWFQGGNQGGFITLLGKPGPAFSSYSVYTGASGGLTFYIGTTTAYYLSADAGAGVWDYRWHHAVGTYDGTYIRLYVDGALVGAPVMETTPIGYNTSSLFIGNYDGGALFFNGSIDEVALWGRALSATEVLQLYRRGANRVKYQLRPCADSACAANPSWQGPDGTNQTYFSESLNNSGQASYSGQSLSWGGDPTSAYTVLTSLPAMLFSNFSDISGLATAVNPYFQYRAVLESDDASTSCTYASSSTWCSPEIQSVSVQTQ